MVQSIINKRLNYPETTAIETEDMNTELIGHETKIYSIPVSICIGKVQNRYSSYGVLYAPIYLVKPNGCVTNIGLYEFTPSKYKYLKQVHGEEELDFHKLSRPLLFSFSTIDYISGIVHGLEKHKLDIDRQLLSSLKEKEKQSDEYERIIRQRMEENKTKILSNNLRTQYDLSTSSLTPQTIYRKNKSRKNRNPF
jgi:hypothetical protein